MSLWSSRLKAFWTQTIAASSMAVLDLLDGDGGDPDPADLPLVAERDHRPELLLQRDGTGVLAAAVLVHPAQVDGGQLLGVQAAQVGLHVLAQLLGPLGRDPATARVAAGADLGDEREVVGVRVQRLTDQGVGDVGAVVLGGVDVVHAEVDGAAQDPDGLVVVAGRAHDAAARQLHRAVADAPHLAVAEGIGAGPAGGDGGVAHRFDASPAAPGRRDGGVGAAPQPGSRVGSPPPAPRRATCCAAIIDCASGVWR